MKRVFVVGAMKWEGGSWKQRKAWFPWDGDDDYI